MTDIDDASQYVDTTLTDMQALGDQGLDVAEIIRELNELSASIGSMVDASDCSVINAAYLGSLDSVCNTGTEGLILMFVACVCAALVFFVIGRRNCTPAKQGSYEQFDQFNERTPLQAKNVSAFRPNGGGRR